MSGEGEHRSFSPRRSRSGNGARPDPFVAAINGHSTAVLELAAAIREQNEVHRPVGALAARTLERWDHVCGWFHRHRGKLLAVLAGLVGAMSPAAAQLLHVLMGK